MSRRHFDYLAAASIASLLGCSGVAPSEGLAEQESPIVRAVVPEKELTIIDPSVIESTVETTFDPAHRSGTDVHGAWSFGRLVHNMLPKADRNSPAAASAFVTRWLQTWEVAQSPNPAVESAAPRTHIRDVVLGPWKVASGCTADASSDDTCVLDMGKAPFRLVAIVNRPDLRVVARDATAIGGEGRFVFQLMGATYGKTADGTFGVVDETIRPQKFTVIFEYSLPVKKSEETLAWANQWHHLGDLSFGSEFNDALLDITNAFSAPDRDPSRPNGNALDQLRTNEVATQGARFVGGVATGTPQYWELREFHLSTMGLVPHTMNQEPSREFDVVRAVSGMTTGGRTADLASFLAANAEAAAAGTHVVPLAMRANSSLVGSAPFGAWGKITNSSAQSFAGVPDSARDGFASNTCAGCHRHETSTPTQHFMHVTDVRAIDDVDKAAVGVTDATPANAVILSNFVRREISPPVASDPGSGARYQDFMELLAMRKQDLKAPKTHKPD
jgi:hypothetical protein